MQSNSELEEKIATIEERLLKVEQLLSNTDARVTLAGKILQALGKRLDNYATVLQTHQAQLEKLTGPSDRLTRKVN